MHKIKILVIFVEPMLYGIDLIHEVYENTPYEFQYLYCEEKLTGRDTIMLPANAIICQGNKWNRKKIVWEIFNNFCPNFVVINGYVGTVQTMAIRLCQLKHVPYAIETDTPLHIPESKVKAFVKKIYLKRILHNKYCYGFPGGTLQKENLVYYGIPDEKCYIMPMSVSEKRLLAESEKIESRDEIKRKFGVSDKKVILFVGRLEAVKNIPILIKAFMELKKTNSELALFIVGNGSEKWRLKEFVNAHKIEDVYFEGYITFPENVRYYKMADVFVLPSTCESWGLVVNEAIIMGLPVVVSSHVGCRKDLVRDVKNGFVFEDNNVIALVENLEKALHLNVIYKITDEWNYHKYLEEFCKAVKCICKK